jgi:Tol biopolymer transport system component
VTNTRPAGTDEIPHEQRHPLLRDLENGRVAPGPGTLRAVVKSDKQHHPFVYIEDSVFGTSRLLLNRTLSAPRWSPDGKKIACTTWKSSAKPWMLCVVDVASGRTLEPEFGAVVSKFKWSPDSKSIAVSGILYGKPTCVLVWVSLPSGRARILDTLKVHADYDFSWSPNSRLLAVSRPTALNSYEEVTRADLWLFDRLGRKCQLTTTDDPETAPAWIDETRLSYERESWRGGEPGASSRMVLKLDWDASPGG